MSDALAHVFAPGQFGTCPVCRRRPALADGAKCATCEHVTTRDPGALAAQQNARAALLIRSAKNVLRWPWADMDTLYGPLRLGTVNYVVAASGMGKTSFVLDLVRRWLAKGVGVTVLPLETDDAEFHLALAAVEVGIRHGEVFTMAADEADGNSAHRPALDLIERRLLTNGADPVRHSKLYVVPDRRVDTESVDKAFAVASAMEHSVVIIDHIDHVEMAGGVQRNTEAGSGVREVNNAILDLAKYHRVCVIAMSQANNSINGDGNNPLERFQAPTIRHVAFNSLKVPNANQVLGLFRDVQPGVSREDFVMAREKVIEPQAVLRRETTSVIALKLRDRGANEGEKVHLWYKHGQLHDFTNADKEHDRLLKLTSRELFGHTTIAYRQRKGKDGTTQRERE